MPSHVYRPARRARLVVVLDVFADPRTDAAAMVASDVLSNSYHSVFGPGLVSSSWADVPERRG